MDDALVAFWRHLQGHHGGNGPGQTKMTTAVGGELNAILRIVLALFLNCSLLSNSKADAKNLPARGGHSPRCNQGRNIRRVGYEP